MRLTLGLLCLADSAAYLHLVHGNPICCFAGAVAHSAVQSSSVCCSSAMLQVGRQDGAHYIAVVTMAQVPLSSHTLPRLDISLLLMLLPPRLGATPALLLLLYCTCMLLSPYAEGEV